MITRLRLAWYQLTARPRTVIVPSDGNPLTDDELGELITVMRAYDDTSGTRNVAAIERRNERAMQ